MCGGGHDANVRRQANVRRRVCVEERASRRHICAMFWGRPSARRATVWTLAFRTEYLHWTGEGIARDAQEQHQISRSVQIEQPWHVTQTNGSVQPEQRHATRIANSKPTRAAFVYRPSFYPGGVQLNQRLRCEPVGCRCKWGCGVSVAGARGVRAVRALSVCDGPKVICQNYLLVPTLVQPRQCVTKPGAAVPAEMLPLQAGLRFSQGGATRHAMFFRGTGTHPESPH
jgi:hypothetical protein